MNATENDVLCREYLAWLKDTKGCRGVTVYNYTSMLVKFLDHLGDTPLSQVTLAQLESFVQRARGGRAHGKPGSAASQSKDATILRAFYSYLIERGYLKRNPARLLASPRVIRRNPRALMDETWLRLWATELPLDERVCYGLGFFAGLRRREVCQLQPHHFVGGRIVGFPRKGGGDDVLDLLEVLGIFGDFLPHLQPERLHEPLAALLSKRGGHAFLMPWADEIGQNRREAQVHTLPPGMSDPNVVNRRLRDRCRTLKMEHLTPHALRHSFVSNLLRAGVPIEIVAELANHSNVSVTWRYVKIGGSRLREWRQGVNRHA